MRSAIFLLLLFLLGCGTANNSFTSKEIIRNATDLPVYLENPASVSGERVCKSPLTDPGDGTKMRLIRSAWPMADYEAPEGKFGLKSTELLRVNCETGEVIGVVRR